MTQTKNPRNHWEEMKESNTVLNYMVHTLSARESQKRWSSFSEKGKGKLKMGCMNAWHFSV